MPRNVRNFWVEMDVDGKRTQVATGPRRADGGFRLNIWMRDKGHVRKALTIGGWTEKDDEVLKLAVYDDLHGEECVADLKTFRNKEVF